MKKKLINVTFGWLHRPLKAVNGSMGITLPPISTHGPQLSSLVADCETEAGTEHEHNEEGSHD